MLKFYIHEFTLKNLQTNFWWALDRTGKPCLLVKNKEVGNFKHLIGSLSHRSISSSDSEILAVTSSITPSLEDASQSDRNFLHQCQVVTLPDAGVSSFSIWTLLSFCSKGILISIFLIDKKETIILIEMKSFSLLDCIFTLKVYCLLIKNPLRTLQKFSIWGPRIGMTKAVSVKCPANLSSSSKLF